MRRHSGWVLFCLVNACGETTSTGAGTTPGSSANSSGSSTTVTVEAPSRSSDAAAGAGGSANGAGSSSASTVHSDAGAAIATSGNTCGTRGPLRLPDGGINYEACVGACSLVHHDAMREGAATPTGSIPLEQVDRALRRDARLLYGCFERVARDHPDLVNAGGIVRVRFVVDATGHVRGNPQATGMEDNPEIGACLSRRVSFIVFPQPVGGLAEVQVPFNFGNNA